MKKMYLKFTAESRQDATDSNSKKKKIKKQDEDSAKEYEKNCKLNNPNKKV